MRFEVLATSGAARRGRLTLTHGVVETPVFMPVGTYGTVKAMSPAELEDIGAQVVLGNNVPPVAAARHRGRGAPRRACTGFMGWTRPILTDSGGFQVWSLGPLRRVQEEGVAFASPVNGDKLFLTPRSRCRSSRCSARTSSWSFDECTPYPATHEDAATSMELSLRWAARSRAEFERIGNANALFGIVQGGMHDDLREASLAGLVDIGFPWLRDRRPVVGEPKEEMLRVLRYGGAQDARRRPRYSWASARPRTWSRA
jgi:queuine tRNA-ribosyltransferase